MNGIKEKEEVKDSSIEFDYKNLNIPKKNKKIPIIIGILIFFIVVIATILINQFASAPIVKINGEKNIEIEYGTNYTDKGIMAFTKLRNISNEVIIENNVDTSKIGTYTVTYKVPYLNRYNIYTRSVIVKDTIAPEITLNGDENLNLEFGKKYEEPGYTAIDDLHYEILDSSGNRADKVRHINITDTTPPEIKLNGNAFISIVKGTKYEEQGATATDNKDGNLSDKIKITGNNFDTSVDGDYKITYTVTDSNGNVATSTRRVVIGDNVATGVIYLTFDDGPSSTITPKILDVLKEKGVHATFFILNYNETNEHLVKREINEGHAIGIHGYSHKYSEIYTSVEACYNNIIKLQDKIYKSTGIKTMLVRFPGGSSNTVSKKYCVGVMSKVSEKILSEGFKYYDWNVLSGDSGDVKTKEGVYNNVTKGIKPGRDNIILMHDFSGNNKTLEALPEIIDYGLNNGYKFEVITTDTEMVKQKIQN